jgi:hypothetical protein
MCSSLQDNKERVKKEGVSASFPPKRRIVIQEVKLVTWLQFFRQRIIDVQFYNKTVFSRSPRHLGSDT